MFDLQAAAFASDITRVFAFKMGRDVSGRVYPETGVNTGFHPASHHGEREERIEEFAKINRYHVSTIPYFLERLRDTPEGDSNLLEKALILYGSPIGQPARSQPQALSALFGWPRQWPLQGQPPRQRRGWYADGEHDVDRAAPTRARRARELW